MVLKSINQLNFTRNILDIRFNIYLRQAMKTHIYHIITKYDAECKKRIDTPCI